MNENLVSGCVLLPGQSCVHIQFSVFSQFRLYRVRKISNSKFGINGLENASDLLFIHM